MSKTNQPNKKIDASGPGEDSCQKARIHGKGSHPLASPGRNVLKSYPTFIKSLSTAFKHLVHKLSLLMSTGYTKKNHLSTATTITAFKFLKTNKELLIYL
jgi:hypothetical protein